MIGLYIYLAIGIALVAYKICFDLIKQGDFKTTCRNPMFWFGVIIAAMTYPIPLIIGFTKGIIEIRKNK